ncbi:MAG: tyrosine-type recombinase/integrase [Promethearchaeota archaeon]
MQNEMTKDWRKRSKGGYFISNTPEYELLLDDESVKKWTSNLKKKTGWKTTIPSFLRTLQRFSRYSGKMPAELVEAATDTGDTDRQEELVPANPQVTELARNFIDELLGSGKRETARHIRTSLLSFFKANGISLKLDVIPRIRKKDDTVLTNKQIYTMADYAGSLRNRAIILCMFQSGLGIVALRNLDYKHVRNDLEKDRIPARVRVTSTISKKASQMPFYAFLQTEACESLKAYINERKRRIERMKERMISVKGLTPESPLFASEGKNVPFGERMAISSIWRVIKNSANRAGLDGGKIQPNHLRRAFEAELNRVIKDKEIRKYLMGSPIRGAKYRLEEIDRKYLMCNFSRQEQNSLPIVKDFVQSLGIKKLDLKIRQVLEKNPKMTEIEAIRLIVRKDYAT